MESNKPFRKLVLNDQLKLLAQSNLKTKTDTDKEYVDIVIEMLKDLGIVDFSNFVTLAEKDKSRYLLKFLLDHYKENAVALSFTSIDNSDELKEIVKYVKSLLMNLDRYYLWGPAVRLLSRLGRIYEQNVTELINALKIESEYNERKENIRKAAASALGNLGRFDAQIISELISTINIRNYKDFFQIRDSVELALGNLFRDDEHVRSALFSALKDESELVRSVAVAALGNSGRDNEEVIENLISSLEDYSSFVRERAALALVKLGHTDDKIIRALNKEVKHQEMKNKEAILALGHLGRTNVEAISILTSLWKQGKFDVVVKAEDLFVDICREDERVLEAVIAQLKDDNIFRRSSAVRVLWKSGRKDDKVIYALLNSLEEDDSYVQKDAALALGGLGRTDKFVIDALRHALNYESAKDQSLKSLSTRSAAACALVKLGCVEKQYLEYLIEALKNEHMLSMEKEEIESTIRRLNRIDEPIALLLIDSMKDKNVRIRKTIAYALGNVKGRNEAVLQCLVKLMKDQDPDVRKAAVESLGNTEQPNNKVFKLLINTIEKDGDFEVIVVAIKALERLGRDDNKKVLKTLIIALKDQIYDVRAAAASAIGRLSRWDEKAIKTLSELLTYYHFEVIRSAALALIKIFFVQNKDLDELNNFLPKRILKNLFGTKKYLSKQQIVECLLESIDPNDWQEIFDLPDAVFKIIKSYVDVKSPNRIYYLFLYLNIKKLKLPVALQLMEKLTSPNLNEQVKLAIFQLIMQADLVSDEENSKTKNI